MISLKSLRPFVYLVLFLLFFTGCRQINRAFRAESPREAYAQKIKDGPLGHTHIAQDWLALGDSVLTQPTAVELPFREKMVYFSDEANARAWKFTLARGRTFQMKVSVSDSAHTIFTDVFTNRNGDLVLEASAQDTILSYTPDQDQNLVLRLQPELLIDGSLTLTITDTPSMEFPVKDGIRADIGSFWGDPRDGGRRRHKGVDVFAERGTPVLATAEGRISRTGNRGLGGKQVWLRAGGKSMYYAHLDSINTHMGAKVNAGDTLGYVGNTGNARTTPPHLHFSIYDRGAINPLPFIDFANTAVVPVSADPGTFSKWGRISAAKANVRPLPSTENPPIASLDRNNPVKVTGGSGRWYRVTLPDGPQGFIYHTLLGSSSSRLSRTTADTRSIFYKEFTDRNPIVMLDSAQQLNVHATYKDRQLVRYKNRWMWMNDE